MGAVRLPKILVLTIDDSLSAQKSIGFPDMNPCDGSLSFPDLGDSVYNGSTPVIVYDAACGVPLAPPPKAKGGQLGAGAGARPEQNPRPALCVRTLNPKGQYRVILSLR